MQYKQTIILLFSLLFCGILVHAQTQFQPQRQSFEKDTLLYNKAKAESAINYNKYSNYRVKNMAVYSDTIAIDTMSIFPNSFTIQNVNTGDFISSENYTLDYAKGKLIFKNGFKPDSIALTYRSFPIQISKSVQHKSPLIIRKGDSVFYQKFYL